MNFNKLTWQQVIAIVALVGAVMAANIFGSDKAAAAVVGIVSTIVAWLVRSPIAELNQGGSQ